MNRPLDGARVLIMEDEYFIAADLARDLREAGADPVGPASTVEEAEKLVTTSRVDAAILDLNLRGRMAFDFVERLSSTGLPCVIVSGYGEDPTLAGRIKHIEKPAAPAKVIEALEGEIARQS